MTCVMTYALMHAVNFCFVFVKLIRTLALCTHLETAKNMLYRHRMDIQGIIAVHLCLANAGTERAGAYTVNCIFTLCSRFVTYLNLALIYGDITFNTLFSTKHSNIGSTVCVCVSGRL